MSHRAMRREPSIVYILQFIERFREASCEKGTVNKPRPSIKIRSILDYASICASAAGCFYTRISVRQRVLLLINTISMQAAVVDILSTAALSGLLQLHGQFVSDKFGWSALLQGSCSQVCQLLRVRNTFATYLSSVVYSLLSS